MAHAYAGIYFIAIGVLLIAIACEGVWLAHYRRRRLRRTVFEYLESAAQNGYLDEHLYEATAEEIANSMTRFQDLQDVAPRRMLPYVTEWLEQRQ